MDRENRSMLRTRASKLVIILVVFVVCVFIIYSWSGGQGTLPETSRGGGSVNQPSSLQAQPLSVTKYLLGDSEDPTKLWYPPYNGSAPQPLPLKQNEAPGVGKRARTPLLIPFTRNNGMLQQTVLSYIAAGWPREDIIIIDNSGTMDANDRGLLSKDNPFYLDYKTLRTRYRVSILQTPTLLSFSQLQNYFLRTSMSHNWRYFFWSHMDVAVLSDEETEPYKSFYNRVMDILNDLGLSSPDATHASSSETWALKYFTYDWLTLINVSPWRKIGQWDTFIPYYSSDCDAYSRVVMNGFSKDDVRAGHLFDIPDVIKDPERKFFPDLNNQSEMTQLNSPRYKALLAELRKLQDDKPRSSRNKWQGSNTGGKGEPWTYDPDGFEKMWWDTAGFGRELYKKKWGTEECRLDEHGGRLSDAFHRGISV
ncbi:hypothetical protein GJ744_001797 [Endocarpon pusillum]|uniref:Uncharacterized protein n=1 Tax=Endocarpon pusillum TaxID=364733 RepID=A0A8H7A9M5_9EURO|nr:hypothetical protein GJ744_001797 [Endocarpon pusillum]